MQDIIREAEERMQKSVEALHTELARMRTARAHPSLVEHVKVPAYGASMPLDQVSSVAVSDARTLVITAWDKTLVPAIEKAILQAELGLNPVTAGDVIRIPIPPLTEERRKEMIKMARSEAESTRVAVRNIRRDTNNKFKERLKAKEISEDENRDAEEEVQKVTDKFIKEIDQVLEAKEKDIMVV